MMTEIGEITVGTLLKRVRAPFTPNMTIGKIYEVVEIDKYGILVNTDQEHKLYIVPSYYEIVDHINSDPDKGILEELDQMLEFCLQYDKLNDYIVKMS